MSEPRPALSAPDRHDERLHATLAIVAVLLLAVGVRLYGLGDEDLWLDEIHTLTATAAKRAAAEALPHGVILPAVTRFTDLSPGTGAADVWRGMRDDSHPPLFFMLHQGWRRIAGDTEFLTRLPAALFSILSVLPIALMLQTYGHKGAGIAAAAVLAVSFSHIHMAQQCRPYSLGMLLVGISFWSVVRMNHCGPVYDPRRRVIWATVHGLACYLALLTHYFTVLPLVGQAVYVAWRVRGPVLRTWCVATVAAAAVYAITWGSSIGAQLALTSAHTWLLDGQPDHVWRTLLRAADLPIRLLLMHEPFSVSVTRSLAGAVLLTGTLGILCRQRVAGTSIFAAWYLVGLAGLIALDLATLRGTLQHIRYASVLAPGLVGMLVLAGSAFARPARIAIMVALMFAVVATLRLPTQSNPHSRVAALEIEDRLNSSSLLVFDAIDWQPFWVSQMYYDVSYYLSQLEHAETTPVVLLRDHPDDMLTRQMASYDRIVVVSPRMEGTQNPSPGTHRRTDRSEYVPQIGVIHVFDRQ